MGTYGGVYIKGEDKSFFIDGDAYPNEVIPMLQDVLKGAKTSKDASHALFDEITDSDTWISLGADSGPQDYAYVVDVEDGTISCVLRSFEKSANKDKINSDFEDEKKQYGDLGDIKIINSEIVTNIVLYAKL